MYFIKDETIHNFYEYACKCVIELFIYLLYYIIYVYVREKVEIGQISEQPGQNTNCPKSLDKIKYF